MDNKKKILWITQTAVFIALLIVLQAATAPALAAAAIVKFLVLYIGIVKLAVPMFLGLPAQQASVASHMFSVPQLITALAGGVIAAFILPTLKRAART